MTELINLNQAAAEELLSLPGMNPERVELIIAGRPYQTVEDLREVKGLGKGAYKKIRDLVMVENESMLAAALAEPEPLEQTGEADDEAAVEPLPEAEALPAALEAAPAPEPEGLPEPLVQMTPLPEAFASEGDNDERPSDESFEESLHLSRIAQVESSAAELSLMAEELPPAPEGPLMSHLPPEMLPAAVEASPASAVEAAPAPQPSAMMVVPAPQPAPAPSVPAAAPKPKTGIGRLELAAWLLGTMFFSVLLGVGLTLGTLALINRGLVYAPATQGNALVETVNALNDQSAAIRQDVESLKTQVGALQAVNTRLDSLSQDLTTLRSDLDAVGARTKTVEAHLTEVDDQVLDLQDQARTATRFFNGLRTLLDEIK
ncbi:MAG TPA: helix-hairpin-helix domain-containing protein [Anaerolineaceae bacterium]|nr:helix-hairpin-helix domain-containing protein [Anaerolineaceae bacterium]HPN52093.1 helix-hairpin-helix domain-containing protein [Anaerolineaceae bacterium]